MIVSTFEVRVLNNLALSQTYFHIKKRDIFFIRLLGKVNRWIRFIKNFQKISQFFFIMHPYKENMINVSEPQQGLQLLHFKKTRLKLALERHAYGGANLGPITVPETCCLMLPLKVIL